MTAHGDLVTGAVDADGAAAWIQDTDRILVAAGAGLSAAAGFDYTDRSRFAELFPAMRERGFTARYELIGQPLPPRLFWGYWAAHVADVRLGHTPNALYRRLRDVVGDRPHAVLSSNVDALFTRNGFDDGPVFTPQGDYALMQCRTPCSRNVWDARPAIERILQDYDPATGETSDEAVPTCPRCGDAVHLNVFAGPWYIADHFEPGLHELEAFLQDTARSGARLTVLEIGSGFNTPGVVRWPVERIVRTLPGSHLVRVNRDHPQVPADLAADSASVDIDARNFITSLKEHA